MAKIAIDARESGTSTGRYIDKLIENLHGLQPNHNIIVLTKKNRLDYLKEIAPKFTVIESPYKEFTFAEQIGFYRQIRDLKVDLVHFGMVQQPVLYRRKVVTTMMDLTTIRFRNPSKNFLLFKFKQLVYRQLNRLVARKSNHIITISEFVKDDVSRFAQTNNRKITVTYPAADKISDNPEPIAELNGKRFIMYVGRPLPHKNLPRLIDAFESLRQKHPDLWLVLTGKQDAVYKQIEADVRRRNLQHVLFTGFASEGQLRWLYENTAAYVFPSLSEGFGLPPLEAMQHGAPVISSDATCLPEVNGDAALYFDPLNVEDIAQKIDLVLTHPTLRNELKAKGKKQVARYSWKRMAEQTLAVYEDVLNNK